MRASLGVRLCRLASGSWPLPPLLWDPPLLVSPPQPTTALAARPAAVRPAVLSNRRRPNRRRVTFSQYSDCATGPHPFPIAVTTARRRARRLTLRRAAAVAGIALVDPNAGCPVRASKPGEAGPVLEVRPGDAAAAGRRVVQARVHGRRERGAGTGVAYSQQVALNLVAQLQPLLRIEFAALGIQHGIQRRVGDLEGVLRRARAEVGVD